MRLGSRRACMLTVSAWSAEGSFSNSQTSRYQPVTAQQATLTRRMGVPISGTPLYRAGPTGALCGRVHQPGHLDVLEYYAMCSWRLDDLKRWNPSFAGVQPSNQSWAAVLPPLQSQSSLPSPLPTRSVEQERHAATFARAKARLRGMQDVRESAT